MSFLRRIFFWIILGLFIGSTVAFLAWTPYRPEDLYRAIPARAVLVSSHRDLAGRWPTLSHHPLLRRLTNPAPSSPEPAADAHPAHQAWKRIARLARKETVIAYLPAENAGDEPAWVGASWIGNASQWIRLALCLKRAPGLERLPGLCNGRTIWIFRRPLTESGARLSLAFGEGLFLGCLSRNPNAMREALMAYDGLAPSLSSSPDFRPDRQAAGRSDALDRGCFRFPRPGGTPDEIVVSYSIARLNAERLSADIGIRPAPPRRTPLAETVDIPALERMLGDLPALVLMLPLETVRDLLDQSPVSTPAHVIREALQSDCVPLRDQHVAMVVLAGDYSGGVGKEPFRLRMPTLIICLKLKDPGGSKALVGDLADNLNAHYRLGLIVDTTPLSAGPTSVTTVEATLPNPLPPLPPEDRPAYATVGSWLILSSNAGSLVKLLQRRQGPAAPAGAPPGRWRQALDADNTAAFLWMDLDVCGRALQFPLTLLNLARRDGSVDAAADRGAFVKSLKTLLEDARPLKTGALWMDSGSPAPALHLELGEDNNSQHSTSNRQLPDSKLNRPGEPFIASRLSRRLRPTSD